VLILPSHGRPFRNLHTRIPASRTPRRSSGRNAGRLRGKPCNAHDIVGVIFRRQFDIHQLTFAIGEALAHLHALWHRGELVRRLATTA
jgi:hypothetical protein